MGNRGWSSQDFVTDSSKLHQALTYLKAEMQYQEASSHLLDCYGMNIFTCPTLWPCTPVAMGAMSVHSLQAQKSFGQGFLELPSTGIPSGKGMGEKHTVKIAIQQGLKALNFYSCYKVWQGMKIFST